MLTLMLALSITAQAPDAPPSQAPRETAPAANDSRAAATANTPEEAFRAFFVAMLTKDEPALRAVTLPAENFEILLAGEAPPPEAIDQIKKQAAKGRIRRLKAGEEVTLPGGRSVKVAPEEATEDVAVILPEGAPIPTRVKRIEGRWLVDATPIIAGRQAAAEAEGRRKGAEPRQPAAPSNENPPRR